MSLFTPPTPPAPKDPAAVALQKADMIANQAWRALLNQKAALQKCLDDQVTAIYVVKNQNDPTEPTVEQRQAALDKLAKTAGGTITDVKNIEVAAVQFLEVVDPGCTTSIVAKIPSA